MVGFEYLCSVFIYVILRSTIYNIINNRQDQKPTYNTSSSHQICNNVTLFTLNAPNILSAPVFILICMNPTVYVLHISLTSRIIITMTKKSKNI